MKYILISLNRTRIDDDYFGFWRANNSGYTENLFEAGIYTEIVKDYHNSDRTLPVLIGSEIYNNLETKRNEFGEMFILNNKKNLDLLGLIKFEKKIKRK